MTKMIKCYICELEHEVPAVPELYCHEGWHYLNSPVDDLPVWWCPEHYTAFMVYTMQNMTDEVFERALGDVIGNIIERADDNETV